VNSIGQTLFVFAGYDGSYCNDLYSFNFVNQIWTKIKTSSKKKILILIFKVVMHL